MTVGTYLARELMMPRALEIAKEIAPQIGQALQRKYGPVPEWAESYVMRFAIERARNEAVAAKNGTPVVYCPIPK